jgi:putative DNA methylase
VLGPVAYADTVACYHSIILGRMIGYSCSLTSWLPKDSALRHAMPRQAIQMMWETAEANPLGKSSGDFETCTKAVAAYLDQFNGPTNATISLRDACSEQTNVSMVCTDPPYYDNIGYADLSDFFYVWHRRTLGSILPELFRRVITPKSEELVANPYRHGGPDVAEAYFMEGMAKALKGLVERCTEWPTTIFYAYKEQELAKDGITSAGWASFLEAVIRSGFAIDGTWPIRSEGSQRANSNDANALSSSILLVCRLRRNSEPAITRADFLRALRREMPAALEEIRRAGIGPTDIQQAAIGPGIGIFTRYSGVLSADGTPVSVRDALKLINQVREEIASTGDADYDSETRFALDWFANKGFEKGKSGDAIVMTNAVNISLGGMNAAGFFEARGGDARLLKRSELPDDWDPAADARSTVWEACQHLIKRLTAEDGGIEAAATLYNRLGGLADSAHALARRLYDICEQKQWASEGRFYDQLHQEWDVIEQRAAALAETHVDLFSR